MEPCAYLFSPLVLQGAAATAAKGNGGKARIDAASTKGAADCKGKAKTVSGPDLAPAADGEGEELQLVLGRTTIVPAFMKEHEAGSRGDADFPDEVRRRLMLPWLFPLTLLCSRHCNSLSLVPAQEDGEEEEEEEEENKNDALVTGASRGRGRGRGRGRLARSRGRGRGGAGQGSVTRNGSRSTRNTKGAPESSAMALPSARPP